MVEDRKESSRVNGHGGYPTEMRKIYVQDEVDITYYDKFKYAADDGGPSVILRASNLPIRYAFKEKGINGRRQFPNNSSLNQPTRCPPKKQK